MFHMEVDSPPESSSSSHYDVIIQKFSWMGIPEDIFNQGYRGLVDYVKDGKVSVEECVSAILPSDELDEYAFRESMIWLQWLMFEGEPEEVLDYLAKVNANQRGVCGSIWGSNDVAYRCRTCENDSTCAICVPCFEKGNHEDHDYSIIYTGGGCCDCGDITAWKREGFCSQHKGAEQIIPLPEHIARPLGPVLDLLLSHWKGKLHNAKSVFEESSIVSGHASEFQKAADEVTCAVIEMLLEFCEQSESLLSFIARRVYSLPGLLDALLIAERFIKDNVVVKLHELLLKLLGEPLFKYEFAKAFVAYYPSIIKAAIESTDTAFRKYQLLPTFAVQVFTVPILTPHMVEEMDLLGMLLQCLENIFVSCAGDDGRLQVDKCSSLYETTIRVVEDIKFVMGHSSVPKYLCLSRQELLRTWMKLLVFMQGMNAQKRETNNHLDDEPGNVDLPFVLCHSISNILFLLVDGAFSASNSEHTNDVNFFRTYKLESDDKDNLRQAKVGKMLEESSTGSVTGKNALGHETDGLPILSSAICLMYECLRSMENWLGLDNTMGFFNDVSMKTSNGSGNNFLALRKTFSLSRFRKGRSIFKSSNSSSSKTSMLGEALHKQSSIGSGSECSQVMGQEGGAGSSDDNMLDAENTSELEGLRVLSIAEWPDIRYDVSTQVISVHIPLHRLLSMILLKALRECCGEPKSLNMPTASGANRSFPRYSGFLGQLLEGCHPHGFSAFLMEHPLRIRVFCAEVHAEMWRRNGDAPILFSEWYRSARWSEQGQELDLFLLQFCAALAPPDLYVQRILERFGLSDYLSLNIEKPSEYEPTLLAEMLTLLVQIVTERRFCGWNAAECLQRELVYKLSIGDATRSKLLKSIPKDLLQNKKLQEVLDTVAEYSHPSGMTQGMYKLRSSYWKELDLYHPRWNLRDQQAAEERYLQFCNVSALITQLPRWTKVYYPLRGIAKIATCETLLKIVRAVLFYAVFTEKRSASRAPDGILLIALHLLALALDICRVQKEVDDPLCHVDDMAPHLAFANEEICTSKYGDQSILSLLVMLKRMHDKETTESFMEGGSFSISPLVVKLIKNFVELEPGCMAKLQKLAPELAYQFSRSIWKANAKQAELACDSAKRKAKSRERQAAMMEKMRAQQSKFLETVSSNEDEEMDDTRSEQEVNESETPDDSPELAEVICSLCHDQKSKHPVSFLVFLQKSRLLRFVGRDPPTWDKVGQSCETYATDSTIASMDIPPSSTPDGSEMIRTTPLEEIIQNAVNDFSSNGQPGEIKSFVEFVKARFSSVKDFQAPIQSKYARKMTASSHETWEEDMYSLIRGFASSSKSLDPEGNGGRLSTVGGSKEARGNHESLLLGKYIAGLPKEALDLPSSSQSDHSHNDGTQPESSTMHQEHDKLGPSGGDGIYVSSCGHAVHQNCLDRYLASLKERYMRRIVFEGGHIVDPDQGEFLCPMCRGFANSVIPALPGDLRTVPRHLADPTDTNSSLCLPHAKDFLRLQDALSLLQKAADLSGSTESLNAIPTRNRKIPNLENTVHLLCRMYYPGQDKILESGRVSHALILWDTLKYSLMSAEIAARSRKTSLCPNYSIRALYKELRSSNGFILSLVLNITQSTRTTNSQTVLLRIHGMQLFARSLCYGSFQVAASNEYSPQGGTMLSILESAEKARFPDVQLWKWATEPVLAHDGFSSLMWNLFCLPQPVLFCKESYLSLVHAFYVVTVAQAIITYFRKDERVETDFGPCDSLIGDIYRVMSKGSGVVQCFDSADANPDYDIKDSIRSLTFPYLRRCALLWKLVNTTNPKPFNADSADDLEYATNTLMELNEIEKLEELFKIPSLDMIVNDEKSRFTVSKWLGHVCKPFEPSSRRVIRCAPAVPFQLIILPHLYQDLLRRFVKKNCPDCGAVKEEPALCLLCGKLCSPHWKPCCRESNCRTHGLECGAGIGVFLLIKRTTILLQRSARMSPWPSPYLDAFGEEDNEMRRGKPLFLSEERYAALALLVASHGLDRSSNVLRLTTVNALFML